MTYVYKLTCDRSSEYYSGDEASDEGNQNQDDDRLCVEHEFWQSVPPFLPFSCL